MTTTTTSEPSPPAPRLASLDQFRGYTVLGMLAVNYLGNFQAVPALFKHHNTYCSYADTIMPQFFFAVGMAYRLTFSKRMLREGPRSAFTHAWRRNLALLFVGLIFHGLGGSIDSFSQLQNTSLRDLLLHAFQRDPFQALTHIALTSFWLMPVMAASSLGLAAYTIASATLFLALSHNFYTDWAWNLPVIDGGPLGFLSWTIPTAAGALAWDLLSARGAQKKTLLTTTAWACFLMLAGYLLSCLGTPSWAPPPFVLPAEGHSVNIWTMSQRTGSISYQTFSAGLSLAVFALFMALSDFAKLRLGIFRTFGTNALVAYLLHPLVADFVGRYTPGDSPLPFVLASTSLYIAICYLFVRHLETHKIFIRL